ncbi:MAG: carbamoyltransferase HypF [bacterium]
MRDTMDVYTAQYRVRGAVQGVGFRPFVYRLAGRNGLGGWIRNDAQGVLIEAIGPASALARFEQALRAEAPPAARIEEVALLFRNAGGQPGPFNILESDTAGRVTAMIQPDLATCPECLAEILDPHNRRHIYPFTNCTNCGPRFSIVTKIPYDRANTTMASFTMCPLCKAEYDNPDDRRFHAQPNACPACGPQLAWWEQSGTTLMTQHDALLAAASAIRYGQIVAVKGLGGFHLVLDARNEEAVQQLRLRKHRSEKPMAVMFPSLQAIEQVCDLSDTERKLLASSVAPIVLLRRCRDPEMDLAASIAPRNPFLGALLPYTPLHHLLMRELGFPVVATSGNLSDEPICTDEDEAMTRLAGLADGFLFHNRPIARAVDDSVARVVHDRGMLLRRARGYAGAPIRIRTDGLATLATGAHLKNTVALNVGDNVYVSQHIGDLDSQPAFRAFAEAINVLEKLYELPPHQVACDMHPDYMSTTFARRLNPNLIQVQHHHAHVASCMADNGLDGEVLGIAWDGTGYGPDGTIWGGEFLVATTGSYKRAAHLRCFPLPGGDSAIKEPRRAAIGLLYELHGDELFSMRGLPPVRSFSAGEINLLRTMLARRVNSPMTSSAGRLFDAVAALIGSREVMTFEGQAAMELEFALPDPPVDDSYDIVVRPATGAEPIIIDWGPMVRGVLDDLENAVSTSLISARFHNALARAIVETAKQIRIPRVVLSGGCFQNAYLTERVIRLLEQATFEVFCHSQVPPNDGGIALGQIAVALNK